MNEMNELETQPAVLRMTLEITRAATGKTETVELIGTPINEGEAQCRPPIQPQ